MAVEALEDRPVTQMTDDELTGVQPYETMKVVELPSTGKSQSRSDKKNRGINWITSIAMVIFHVLAIVALFMFTWKGLIAAVVLYVLAINVGIGMTYHRLLTHRGYKVPRWLEYVLATCATLALEGGPIFWVATHRVHHQHSDRDGDPHSPNEGTWWSHMGWIVTGQSLHADVGVLSRYAPDLTRDRFHVLLSKYHWVPLTVVGLGLLAWGGWPVVMWGIFLRVTLGLHATWLVNSATHIWGSRRFETRDDSRNSWWVALLTGGEGWHNNHHAHTPSRHATGSSGTSSTLTITASGCSRY